MKLLIVTGSARPTSVNQHVVAAVKELADQQGEIETTIADLSELDLPLLNSAIPPSDEGFEITDERVQRWSDMVNAADAVLFVLPEYNRGMTGIQKNAFDWLFHEWRSKPVSGVAYGWHNGKYAAAAFDVALWAVKAKIAEPISQLQFKEVIDLDGTILDRAAFDQRINATLGSLLRLVKQ